MHLKLLATPTDADFEFLEQESVRFVRSHPLQDVAALYHSGKGRRSLVPPRAAVAPEMDWTTVTMPLGIRREDWRRQDGPFLDDSGMME